MRILNLQNNSPKGQNSAQAGFTLIETILAVGILGMIVGSIIGLQSSIMSVTQTSGDKIRASWALKQAASQVEYLIDVKGQAFLPEKIEFPWSGNNEYSVSVERKNLTDLKPSMFLKTAMKSFNMGQGDESTDVDTLIAPLAGVLDALSGAPSADNLDSNGQVKSPSSLFCNVIISSKWKDGLRARELSQGMLLIDASMLTNIKNPFGGKSGGGSKGSGGAQ